MFNFKKEEHGQVGDLLEAVLLENLAFRVVLRLVIAKDPVLKALIRNKAASVQDLLSAFALSDEQISEVQQHLMGLSG